MEVTVLWQTRRCSLENPMEIFIKVAICVIAVIAVMGLAISPMLADVLPGIRRYRKTGKLRPWLLWAVVVKPGSVLGEVKTLHTFRWVAIVKAGDSPYHTVMSAQLARDNDKWRARRLSPRIVDTKDISEWKW